MTPVPIEPPRPLVTVAVDGHTVRARTGSSVLEACAQAGVDLPTLCWLETLTPVNACRICVVEVVGSRTLVPACSRAVEPGMEITTGSDRVRHSRRMILEFLATSVDLGTAGERLAAWLTEYGVDLDRYAPASGGTERRLPLPGHHPLPDGTTATVAQPVKIEDDLYVRDYAKCILCYKCVEACGADAQNTFAISVSGRGFDATIATEFDVALPESACVYCGNCIGVCPTGALMGKVEHDMRSAGTWDPPRQTVTRTVCPFCGVGCNLDLHVQDNEIVKVTSPLDHDVTSGHLCIKGRFGVQHVHPRV